MPRMTLQEATASAPFGFGYYKVPDNRTELFPPRSPSELLASPALIREGFLQNINERTTRQEFDELIRALAHIPTGRLTTSRRMQALKEDIRDSMKLRVPVQLLYLRGAEININSANPQPRFPIRSVARATLDERSASGDTIINNLALMDDDYWDKLLRDIESFELGMRDGWVYARATLYPLFTQHRRFDLAHTYVDPLNSGSLTVGYEPNFKKTAQVHAALIAAGNLMEAHAEELHLLAYTNNT